MMFCFGSQGDNGLFEFVQNKKGHIYTWPSEKIARSFYEETGDQIGHIYQIDPDLSMATLVQASKSGLGAPQLVIVTEEQKPALYESFVYKSLLAWVPDLVEV
jgi:hypothetical protein